jgi:hypothetical protein
VVRNLSQMGSNPIIHDIPTNYLVGEVREIA